jgi:hypothetical protein
LLSSIRHCKVECKVDENFLEQAGMVVPVSAGASLPLPPAAAPPRVTLTAPQAQPHQIPKPHNINFKTAGTYSMDATQTTTLLKKLLSSIKRKPQTSAQ